MAKVTACGLPHVTLITEAPVSLSVGTSSFGCLFGWVHGLISRLLTWLNGPGEKRERETDKGQQGPDQSHPVKSGRRWSGEVEYTD